MPDRPVRLMLAVLAAPCAAMGLAQAAQAAPDRYGAPVYSPPEDEQVAPVTYLNWPGKTPAPVAAPSPQAPAQSPAPLSLAGGPPTLPVAAAYAKGAAQPVSRLRLQIDGRAAQIDRLLRQAEPIGDRRPVRSVRTVRHGGHITRIIRVVQVVHDNAPAAIPMEPEATGGAISPQVRRPAPVSEVQPASVPASAQPASPQPAAVAANGLAPRFYSVHRQFGVQPDPIPLPAQFFGDSPQADLAAPPPPLPPRVILGQGASSTASVQRAVAAANLAAGDANTSN
jgi:hypothetical protein